jgi:hypothetical protein
MALWRIPKLKDRTYAEIDSLFEHKVPARKFASNVELFGGDLEPWDLTATYHTPVDVGGRMWIIKEKWLSNVKVPNGRIPKSLARSGSGGIEPKYICDMETPSRIDCRRSN